MTDEVSKFAKYLGHTDYIEDFLGAQLTLQERSVPVSDFVDFNKQQVKTPLSDDGIPRYAMNHPYDLLDLLRHKDNNVYLNEALLMTWDIDDVIAHYRKTIKKLISASLQKLTFKNLYANSTNNQKIIDFFKLGHMQDKLVSFVFPFQFKSIRSLD